MAETVFFLALSVLSIRDLRSYVAPGSWLVSVMGLFIGLYVDPLRAFFLAMLLLWTILGGRNALLLPLLLHPTGLLVAPVAYAVREGMMGISDLLVLVAIAAIFPLQATFLSLLGMWLWVEWWRLAYKRGPIPLLPGIAFGFAVWMTAVASALS